MNNTQQNGFDLNSIPQVAEIEDQGTVVHLHGPDEKPYYFMNEAGKEEPVTITVAGEHSSRYRRAESQIRRRKLKPKSLTGEVFHEDTIEKAAACVISWRGIVDNGQPLECTRQAATQIFKRAPWVLDQVTDAMQDHTRFFGNSSPRQ